MPRVREHASDVRQAQLPREVKPSRDGILAAAETDDVQTLVTRQKERSNKGGCCYKPTTYTRTQGLSTQISHSRSIDGFTRNTQQTYGLCATESCRHLREQTAIHRRDPRPRDLGVLRRLLNAYEPEALKRTRLARGA